MFAESQRKRASGTGGVDPGVLIFVTILTGTSGHKVPNVVRFNTSILT
jgi:hypothetical protein